MLCLLSTLFEETENNLAHVCKIKLHVGGLSRGTAEIRKSKKKMTEQNVTQTYSFLFKKINKTNKI